MCIFGQQSDVNLCSEWDRQGLVLSAEGEASGPHVLLASLNDARACATKYCSSKTVWYGWTHPQVLLAESQIVLCCIIPIVLVSGLGHRNWNLVQSCRLLCSGYTGGRLFSMWSGTEDFIIICYSPVIARYDRVITQISQMGIVCLFVFSQMPLVLAARSKRECSWHT